MTAEQKQATIDARGKKTDDKSGDKRKVEAIEVDDKEDEGNKKAKTGGMGDKMTRK